MRKIAIKNWTARVPERDAEGKIIGATDGEENLLIALNVLIGNKKPEQMPRGLDKFRLFNRLNKAFEKAEKKGVLELEEFDYKFLKDTIESDVPSTWGMNNNLNDAIEEFLNAPEIK
jgi:hypothetical protein